MTPDRTAERIAQQAREFRARVRAGEWAGQTAGSVPGALQANLAVVPGSLADAFAAFCAANPKPCPLLGKTDPGTRFLPALGRDLDVARDAPAYRIFRDGERAERVETLSEIWRDDFVAFALGCSFSFEDAMERAGIPVRHARLGKNVPMYITAIETVSAGPFGGPMVVSMRPILPDQIDSVHDVCRSFPLAHGTPIHVGDPAQIGIANIHEPDFGDAPDIYDGEICAFWACGVTPQMALQRARPEIAATHEPGHMLITDLDATSPALEQLIVSLAT